ncbi:unnamed protein product [Clavelina lepadiformis]|uniref:Secreted protein n=1 Tax=Clavelina lepadiformis TaxID=159417 RepID=A0ABP0GQS9_CLALP
MAAGTRALVFFMVDFLSPSTDLSIFSCKLISICLAQCLLKNLPPHRQPLADPQLLTASRELPDLHLRTTP